MKTRSTLRPVLCFRAAIPKDTYQEATESLKEAIKLHIKARQSLSEPIPIEVAPQGG